MGFLSFLKTKTDRSTSSVQMPYLQWLYGASDGVSVNEDSALSLAAFWSGVRRISESLATLPIDVKEKRGGKRIQVPHDSERLLNKYPNDQTIAFDFRQVLVSSAIMHGNGLAIIERDANGTAISLKNVRKDICEPIVYDDEIFWKVSVKTEDKKGILVNDRDMINIRGFGTDPVIGMSVLQVHRQNLGLSLSAQRYGKDFFDKSARLDGWLEYQGKLDAATSQAISSQWQSNYGSNGTTRTAILDNGTKYHSIGLPPEDAQFIETRKFQKNEIATILNIPAHMVNELENATFSNIEHQNLEFLTYTLGVWIEKCEQEFSKKLLIGGRESNYYYEHDINRLLRTDIKAQAEYVRQMLDSGFYTINEARERMGYNPVENGDIRTIQINRIPIEKINDYYGTKNDNNDS